MSQHDEHRIRERAYELWVQEGQPEGRHAEHWYAAAGERELAPKRGEAAKSANEGEGNVTAARAYNKATRKFIQSGKVGAKAEEAKKAIDGPEGPSLRQAEIAGKRRARGAESTKSGT